MNRLDRNFLLEDVFADDGCSPVISESLKVGLRAIQRRRRARLILRIGGMIILPVLLAAAFVLLEREHGKARAGLNLNLAQGGGAGVGQGVIGGPGRERPERAVAGITKMITDDELFCLFPGRSMALIGTPGSQQLVFLDRNRQSDKLK
jgi:hypothetical protein